MSSRLLQKSKRAALSLKQDFAPERNSATKSRTCSRCCLQAVSLSCTRIQTSFSRQPLKPSTQPFQQLFPDVSGRCSASSRKVAAYHAVSAAQAGDGSLDQPGLGNGRATNVVKEALRTVQQELDKLNGQWDKFLPMILVSQSLDILHAATMLICRYAQHFADSVRDAAFLLLLGRQLLGRQVTAYCTRSDMLTILQAFRVNSDTVAGFFVVQLRRAGNHVIHRTDSCNHGSTLSFRHQNRALICA